MQETIEYIKYSQIRFCFSALEAALDVEEKTASFELTFIQSTTLT